MEILRDTTNSNFFIANHRDHCDEPEIFVEMGAPGDGFFGETLHSITINTRETDFGSVIEPIPIMIRSYNQYEPKVDSVNDATFGYHQSQINCIYSTPLENEIEKDCNVESEAKAPYEKVNYATKIARPPKKKWIKEYLEEEPSPPVSLRVTEVSVTGGNGLVRPMSPEAVAAPAPASVALVPSPAPRVSLVEPSPAPAAHTASLLDFVQEHSKQRVVNSHGTTQIPSPTSSNGASSNGSVPRAGTREVHNKLEKNRRAHLKECFELLKRQLPATPDDKKTSNLAILGSAIRYIQVLRRKERECEHELERLAREKIAAQQRLAALKRELHLQSSSRPRVSDPVVEDDRNSSVNGNITGTSLSITSSPPLPVSQAKTSPTLNVNTNLRSLPLQISSAPTQVRTSPYGARHNTITLTTLSPIDSPTQSCQDNGVANTLGTLVHPAQIHLPLSQVVGNGSLVVGPAALQLLSTSGLRVLQGPTVHSNGLTTDSAVVVKENGTVTTPTVTSGVVVNGLSPIVVSQPAAHLLQTHALAHKVVETQMVKGSVAPLTVSARYLSATTIVKPVVVVSSAPSSST